MYRPPSHRPDSSPPQRLTWQGIIVGYAWVAVFVLLLWVLGDPLVRGATLAVLAGLLVGVTRAVRLAQCLWHCRKLTVKLPGKLRISIEAHTDDSC